MKLTRLVVSAVGLAALSLLFSTCRLDSLFQSRAPNVEIELAGDTVAVKDSVDLRPVVTIDRREPAKPLPLRWSSSNSDVASVDTSTGRVRGVARGTAIISVRLAPSALGEVSAEGRDTVRVIAASVALAPGDTSMQSVGDTLCYRATARDVAGGTIAGAIPGLRIVTDPDATVQLAATAGCVVALRAGAAATIEASLDTSKARGTLSVRQRVTSLDIPVESDTLLGLGSTETYSAAARDRRGNLAPAATITWSSTDAAVITVDATGRATAQGEGVAYVRAGADDGADSVRVTVTPPRLVVSLDTARATASEGNTAPRTVKVAISNTGTGSVDWTATGAGTWLSLSKTSGTAPDTVTFTFDPTGQTAGTLVRDVIITSPGAANSPDTVPAIFVIAPPTVPDVPQAFVQLRTDGTTAVSIGGATDETSILLRAQLADPDEDAAVVFEVEVRPVGTPFNDTATTSSAAVATGQTATVTVPGLVENTDYHWQARVRDETGRTSGWVSFGSGNDESSADFRMAIPENPLSPTGLGQYRSSDGSSIPANQSINETSVVFKGTVNDPDPGDRLRLEVELKRVGTAFDGSVTAVGEDVARTEVASVTISGIPDDGNYYWRARVLDQTGRTGPWVQFPTPTPNPESQADFHIPAVPEPPDAPTNVSQLQNDGVTPIPVGGTAIQTTVVLKARLTDPDPGDQLQLEVEVRPLGTLFSSVATATSAAVASGATATVTVPSLLEDTPYHWQYRTRDQTGRLSQWVSFGSGNAEDAADFRVALPEPPNAPTTLGQFQSNDAPIAVGATIDERTVVFRGTIIDPDPGDQVRLEVETKPIGVAFDSSGTVLGTLVGGPVTTGVQAAVTVGNQGDDTSYHWRVRALDQTGRGSGWVSGGANDDQPVKNPADTDYRIVVPESPAAPADPGQFKSNGTTAITLGGTTDENTVVFQARLTDPDPGDQLRLEVEVKRTGVTFDSVGTLTSGPVASGAVASVTVSPLSDDTTYHWRLRAIDQDGRGSAWVGFGGNAESAADFRVAVPETPATPTGLGQFRQNGTQVPTGSTTGDTVVFKATLSDVDPGDQLWIEVEVQIAGEPFTNSMTARSSTPVASGQEASVTIGPLSDDTDYRWQARAVDQTGRKGPWVAFAGGGTAFRVDVPGAPSIPTSLQQFRSDSMVAIGQGATTNERTVVLKALVTDADLADSVRIQVEVKRVGEGFTGSNLIAGALVAKDEVASVRVTNLADDTTHEWRARAVDKSEKASAWVPFGAAGIDFFVKVPERPATPTSLLQRRIVDATSITTGDTTGATSVVLEALISDPDPGDQVRLDVEVRPIVQALMGTPTDSTILGAGGTVQLTVSGLTDDTDYHWRARTRDQSDSASVWVSFGANADGVRDFRVTVPQAPAPPSNSDQFKVDGSTAVVLGTTTDQKAVMFKARLTDLDPGDQLLLEVEVKPVTATFDSVDTRTSAPVASGNDASITVTGLPDNTDYHWRLRAIDQTGRASAWTGFGGNADTPPPAATDFRVEVPEPPFAPGSPGQFSTADVALTVGQITTETSVKFKATLTDPDPGAMLRLQVEVKPIDASFDGTVTNTSAPVPIGTDATVTVATPPLTENAAYHWRARTIDNTDSASAWVSFGGNGDVPLPAATDFSVNATPESPSATALGQLLTDGTPIALGGNVNDTTILFKATLTDPDPGATIRLEVEWKPIAQAFDSTTVLSTPVSNGGQALVIAGGQVSNTSYHWRARAIDTTGLGSAWVGFGGNPDSPLPAAADYLITVPDPPDTPSGLGQFKIGGDTAIAGGGTTNQNTVVLKGMVTDPDVDDLVRLVVEVKPIGTAFDSMQTDTSTAVASGATAQLTKVNLGDDADYHWRARTIDQSGRKSGWVSFGGTDGTRDFRVAVPQVPGLPAERRQFKSGGIDSIPVGDTTRTSTVVLRALLTDPDADQVKLEVEWQPLDTAFTNTPRASSGLVASGNTAEVTVTGLRDNVSYHWQVRAVDQTDSASAWVSYGGNADSPLPAARDFHVWIPENPVVPSSPNQFKGTSATAIPTGGITDSLRVTFKATVDDVDPGDSLRIEVERQPLGTAFTGVATLAGDTAVAPGQVASVTITNLENTRYHWQVRSVDRTGLKSSWISFPTLTNPEDSTDYSVNSVPENPSPPVTTLGQFRANGSTPVQDGETIDMGALTSTIDLVFKATLLDRDPGDLLHIQVQVRPTSQPFTNDSTHAGTQTVNSGQQGQVTVTLPNPGLLATVEYHWQARACDQTGRCGTWVPYPANNPAFKLRGTL